MLKRLLIAIFVLQSFAFNALASTNMSQLNQAETTKMQIMHQNTVDDTSSSISHSHNSCLTESSQTQNMIDYCSCDHDGNCHNLLCNSIHANNPIDSKAPYLFSAPLLVGQPVIDLSSTLSQTYYPPETPPPLV